MKKLKKVVFPGNIEFAGVNKVAVKSFLRNGIRVQGFVRKVKGAKAAKKAIDSLDPKMVEGFVKKGDLPKRGELLLALTKNPVKQMEEGFRRERDFMRLVENMSGRQLTKAEVIKGGLQLGVKNIKESIADPAMKKELTVNLGGFLGSVAGKATGVPGVGVAADLAGARVTRRALDDRRILTETLKNLQGDAAYNATSRKNKIGMIYQEAKKLKHQQRKENRTALVGDTAGWIGGNFLPIPVPQGGLISGMTSGKLGETISSMIPPKTFEEAVATVLSSSVRKGNRREEKVREEIKEQWLAIQNRNKTEL